MAMFSHVLSIPYGYPRCKSTYQGSPGSTDTLTFIAQCQLINLQFNFVFKVFITSSLTGKTLFL